jgi:hypothetical protein
MIHSKEKRSADIRQFSFIPLKIKRFNHFLQNQKEEAPEMLLN